MFKSLLVIGISASALLATGAGAVTFAYTGAVQNYTVVSAGIYKLQAYAAQGGSANDSHGSGFGGTGLGAAVGRAATIGANTSVNVTVGGLGGGTATLSGGGGGGGGTFIRFGSQPVLVAGGGGGDGVLGYAGSGSLTTAGGDSYPAGSSDNGYGGSGGNDYFVGGAGGGAGVYSAGYNGSNGIYSGGGGGGGSAPNFAGGKGSHPNNSGGFGGGGGGNSQGGGGGGGYSGGAGSSTNSGGGGGGSYGNDSTFAAVANHVGNGAASIDAIRLFAGALAFNQLTTPNVIGFGTVRFGMAKSQSVRIINTGPVSSITDTLVTTLGAMPSDISSTAAPGPIAANGQADIAYTLQSNTPGVFSGNVSLGFASHAASGPDIALSGKTFAVTGTVTDIAYAILGNTGSGRLTLVNGGYLLDFGDVAAGSGAIFTDLSVRNDAAVASYGEALGGAFTGLSTNGFSFTGGTFNRLAGGAQLGLGTLGFDLAGLSSGLHSQVVDFETWSHFAGFDDLNLGNFSLTVQANVLGAPPVAGVPEPATWALLVGGFGMIGAAMRRRKLLTA